jgi:hypothetical protein
VGAVQLTDTKAQAVEGDGFLNGIAGAICGFMSNLKQLFQNLFC